MRVVCVYSVEGYVSVEKPMLSGGDLPFGIATIASVVQHAGHDVDTLVMTRKSPIEDMVAAIIRDFKPRVFCMTAVTTQFYIIARVAKAVKAVDPTIRCVLGGHHASLCTDSAASVTEFDALCIGEGERGIVEYLRQYEEGLDPTGVPGFWLRRGSDFEKNTALTFNYDLDSLPFIDRDLWTKWMAHPYEWTAVLVGRGCPFTCTYCSNHVMRKLADGKYVRFRSVDNLIAEIADVMSKHPVRNIHLEVETIGANPEYAKELSRKLAEYNSKRERPIWFEINLALTKRYTDDEPFARELLSELAAANIKLIYIGLESGSMRVRNEVMRRPKYTNEGLLRFAKLANSYGIDIGMNAMMGLPSETVAEYLETVDICHKVQPKHVYIYIFYPYPGTELYNRTLELGLISNDAPKVVREREFVGERSRAFLNTKEFPRWRVQLEFILFYYKVYRGHWPAMRLLLKTVRQITTVVPVLNSFYLNVVRSSKIFSVWRRKYSTYAEVETES
ncbi:MAG: B12-binding domain-containing radical SAM protein [Alphaproteobacteria bacterium]|nr:B12-binding domain-containing radical SAM protein [Alphaproteobacteria bacterium]